jgi:hypothetical protein
MEANTFTSSAWLHTKQVFQLTYWGFSTVIKFIILKHLTFSPTLDITIYTNLSLYISEDLNRKQMALSVWVFHDSLIKVVSTRVNWGNDPGNSMVSWAVRNWRPFLPIGLRTQVHCTLVSNLAESVEQDTMNNTTSNIEWICDLSTVSKGQQKPMIHED